MIRTTSICGGSNCSVAAAAASSRKPLLNISNFSFSCSPLIGTERSPLSICRSHTQSCKSLTSLPLYTSSHATSTTTSTTFRFRWSKRTGISLRCFSALTPELKTTLDKVVTGHTVVLFMKGTKEFPQCGFSNTIVQILKSLNVPFETLNILENEILRQALKEYSNWPTFPQLYIDGEFFGGCDITVVGLMPANELTSTSTHVIGPHENSIRGACVMNSLRGSWLRELTTIEAYKSGELQELLEKAMCS